MQERDIFIEALQKEPAELAAFLTSSCGQDETLRQRVEGLLAAHQKQESFLLDSPAAPLVDAPTTEQPARQCLGTQIGPYKLLQVIGEGGMGIVYLAEQRQPVERKAALKIIKPGMDSRQVIARFEAERQALALMDHPNIAKVLDAGTTDQGHPFFVMELVKGVPITKYCDEKHLNLKQRLELMIPVCQAIQHAHQKGIIHRDIKPTNVLIAQYDGRPAPKVIDFGVAKATAQRLTERTMFTELGQVVGTLEYMSPEQAELNQLDIDTRSDVYSLGVLLYELLTGSTPLGKQKLRTEAFHEMLRIIREDEPPKPSTTLSTIDTLASIAANRNVEPARLTKSIRGELDWIAMKALEKDRNRRYQSVGSLAADIQHYLADEPVQACPPSALYRFRKFFRRNRALLTTASFMALFVALAMVAAGAFGWWQLRQQAAIEHQIELALQEASIFQGEGKWTPALVAVKRAESLLTSFTASESVQRRVRDQRRDIDTASTLEEVRLRTTGIRDGKGYDGFEYLVEDALDDLFGAFRRAGIDLESLDAVRAGQLIRERSICQELLAALDHSARLLTGSEQYKPTAARLLHAARQADANDFRNQIRLAVEQANLNSLDALAQNEQVKDLPPATIDLLADALRGMGRQKEAVALLRDAQRRNPQDFWINGDLARMLVGEEQLRFHTAALAARPQSADAYINVAYSLAMRLRRFDEAIPLLHEGIRLHPDYAHAHNVLGQVLTQKGDFKQAEAAFREAIRINPNHAAVNNLASLYANSQGAETYNPAVAVQLAKQAIAFKSTHKYAWATLGNAHYRAGNWHECISAIERAISINPSFEHHGYYAAMAHWQLGNETEARRWYDRSVNWSKQNMPGVTPVLHVEATALLQIKDDPLGRQKKADNQPGPLQVCLALALGETHLPERSRYVAAGLVARFSGNLCAIPPRTSH